MLYQQLVWGLLFPKECPLILNKCFQYCLQSCKFSHVWTNIDNLTDCPLQPSCPNMFPTVSYALVFHISGHYYTVQYSAQFAKLAIHILRPMNLDIPLPHFRVKTILFESYSLFRTFRLQIRILLMNFMWKITSEKWSV